jgi:hypothetical protein
MKAHFFDLDTLILMNQEVWIVDKENPNIPLMKITKSDFNLIKSGIFKSQGNKIEFNDKTFWLPINLINKLKIKSKNSNIDFSNLGLSMQEFINKDIIDGIEFKLNIGEITKLKNTNDDIYIICSSQTKRTHEEVLEKLSSKLKKEGLVIKNYYFISETFYNKDEDEIRFKKQKLLIQHSVGYRTDFTKFVDEEITRYDTVCYYDNDYDTLYYTKDINRMLSNILSNTEEGLRKVIEEDIKEYTPIINITQVYNNEVNNTTTKSVELRVSNIMTFESFNWFKNSKSEKLYRKIKMGEFDNMNRDILSDHLITKIEKIFNKVLGRKINKFYHHSSSITIFCKDDSSFDVYVFGYEYFKVKYYPNNEWRFITDEQTHLYFYMCDTLEGLEQLITDIKKKNVK